MTAALDHPGVSLRSAPLIALRRLAIRPEAEVPLSALPGGLVSKRRGQGQEMADVREYVAGDDIRHLDRGSTARTGTLHVRSFQEERDRVSLLVADFRSSMLWGSRRAFRSVAAAEALTLIGWRVIEEGGRVGLLALSDHEPVAVIARGRARGMLAVIGGLVRAHDAALRHAMEAGPSEPPLELGLARAERVAPTGADVVIASGFDHPGAGLQDRLGQLAQRRHPRLIRITDAAATDLPAGLYPVRLPDGAKRRVRIAGPRQGADPAQIAGFPALHLDAGDTVATYARRLDGAGGQDG